MKKLALLSLLAFVTAAGPASAAFITFTGGTAAETAWRTAVGTFQLETFDSYGQGNVISSLPALGVSFDLIPPNSSGPTPGFPAVYVHSVDNTPSGPQQLSNMPNGGAPDANFLNADIILRALSGFNITALGFWNGDPNGPMVISVFDAADNLLGSVSAPANINDGNAFGGFVSDVLFARISFEGTTGDGYNHIDDLQTNASRITAVPEPGTVALISLGLFTIAARRRRKAS